MNLSETHRPASLDSVVGQSKVVSMLQRRVSSGTLGSAHYWLAGKSGTGKTTIARIIASHLGSEVERVEVVGRSVKSSDVNEWSEVDATFPMWGTKRVYIVNEAHGMSRPVVEHFLNFLESARNSVVIFTTTLEGQAYFDDSHLDAGPLLSRCIAIRLESQGLAGVFVDHVATITGLDRGKIARFVKDNGPNLRQLWNHVESGAFD